MMSNEEVNPLFKEEASTLLEVLKRNDQHIPLLKEFFSVKTVSKNKVETLFFADYKSLYKCKENRGWVVSFEVKNNKIKKSYPFTVHVLILSPPNICIYGEELFSNYSYDWKHRVKVFEMASRSEKPYIGVTQPSFDISWCGVEVTIPKFTLAFVFAKEAHYQNSSFHYSPYTVTYSYPRKNITISFPVRRFYFQGGSYRMPYFNEKLCFFKPPLHNSKKNDLYKNYDCGAPYEVSTLYVGEKPQKITFSREVSNGNGKKNTYQTIFYVVPLDKKFGLE